MKAQIKLVTNFQTSTKLNQWKLLRHGFIVLFSPRWFIANSFVGFQYINLKEHQIPSTIKEITVQEESSNVRETDVLMEEAPSWNVICLKKMMMIMYIFACMHTNQKEGWRATFIHYSIHSFMYCMYCMYSSDPSLTHHQKTAPKKS